MFSRPLAFFNVPWRSKAAWLAASVFLLVLVTANEVRNSSLQARVFSSLTRGADFELGEGASSRILFPRHGPYDERLGYASLPKFTGQLRSQGFVITRQARNSDPMLRLMQWGLFPPYAEKNQAGLAIIDQVGNAFYRSLFPSFAYETFEDIPSLMVKSLLYVENRELFHDAAPTFNPAIEWDRFFLSTLGFFGRRFSDDAEKVSGGSTLATQLEKFRHSPGGITHSGAEKLRQMMSASVRAYVNGSETLAARRKIALDYVNSVPLSAVRGYGEVNGLVGGMWAWYGVPVEATNAFLTLQPEYGSDFEQAQGLVYKQLLSLVLAQRRPSYYLSGDAARLNALTNAYLELMMRDGVIPRRLYESARPMTLAFRRPPSASRELTLLERKPTTALRARLLSMLDLKEVYDLDKLDLEARTTIKRPLQNEITVKLGALKSRDGVAAAGLYGDRLLRENDDLSPIVYSMTLYERVGSANVVRVQTDNFDGPFNINEGVRLDLGSTAKFRALATYLEIIAQLYERFSPLDAAQLAAIPVDDNDQLTLWAVDYLTRTARPELPRMLEAALDRTYSANPNERFFTGGGLHTFRNFEPRDNNKVMTVREALNNSVNLVFVRLMRDVVRYYMFQVPGSTAQILEDTKDERRTRYLARFADKEGTTFVERFYRKYRRKEPAAILDTLIGPEAGKIERVAVIYRSVSPERGFAEFAGYLLSHAPELGEVQLRQLFDKYDPAKLTWPDRGFLARLHPLELWTAKFLIDNPQATLAQAVAASTDHRQAVYQWLFNTRHKNVQDARIKQLLEIEAFLEVLKHWKALRFPFDSLTPSYASALGSSGDRPAALAELMGIVVNDGVFYPTVVIDQLRFGLDTPYETWFERRPAKGTRVMTMDVAVALRTALAGVVDKGTGKRVAGVFKDSAGRPIMVGGKTGTGDHRRERYGPRGVVLGSEVVNRTATFVFFIGERHFGTITAFVPGKEAANYRFTSGLPVQLLKTLAPTLAPYVAD